VYHLDGLDEDEPDWHHIHMALGRIHRFGGRSRLTVLHHAFATMEMLSTVSPDTQRLGFLHDHHEALVGDVPYPVKQALGGAFDAVEALAERYIRQWFDLDGAVADAVKMADVALTFGEAIHEGIATWTCPWIAESGWRPSLIRSAAETVKKVSRLPLSDLTAEADALVARWRKEAKP